MYLLCVLFSSSPCHAIFAAWDGVISGEAGAGVLINITKTGVRTRFRTLYHVPNTPAPFQIVYTHKKLIEKSRECHNLRPQRILDTKRKSKRTKPNACETNKTQEAYRPTRTPKRGTVFDLISPHALISTHSVFLFFLFFGKIKNGPNE